MKVFCKHVVRMDSKSEVKPVFHAREVLKFLSVGMIALLLLACNSMGNAVAPTALTKFPNMNIPKMSKSTDGSQFYVIQPGDELSIKFYFNPDLNEENLVVRPDGNISLQLVHEVIAAGRTPIELKGILSKKYAKHLNSPEIAVIVRTVKAPSKIYVGGEVRQPGEFEMVSSMTVLQAIALAQGMEPTASESNVLVIRRTQENEPSTIRLNLKAALAGDDLSQDISLHPYDYVYVPESFW